MDTTRHLLGYFFKVALFFFALALAWVIISIFAPAISFRSLMGTGTTTSQDWLPSPRAFTGFLSKRQAQTAHSNVYVPGPAFDGYNLNNSSYSYSEPVSYVTYDSSGTVVTKDAVKTPTQTITNAKQQATSTQGVPPSSSMQQAALTNKNLFIRNLSIFEGGHLYTGLSFVGEARSTMFKGGRFPIIVVDQMGRVVGVSAAVATTDWTVAGWTRFETKLQYPLPTNTPCTMVFEEALLPAEKTRLPLHFPVAMRCN